MYQVLYQVFILIAYYTYERTLQRCNLCHCSSVHAFKCP
jgi:hypothetical protein